MIVDTRTLLGFFDRKQRSHWALRGTVELAAETEPLVVSPFVIAELEGIVRERYGERGWLAVLDELAGGAWVIAAVTPEHLAAVRERVAGGATLADASVAALAEE